jgi:solute carrier family 20 (sodium-dependent phosphate transporter)
MGPLLWKENYSLYYPGNPESRVVPNYYASEYKGDDADSTASSDEKQKAHANDSPTQSVTAEPQIGHDGTDPHTADSSTQTNGQKELQAMDSLPWAHPKRIFYTIKFVLFHGLTRDVIGHQNKGLDHIHERAPRYDNKVEHLWTTAQVLSAMIMSVAHGANDVSNAIGPFTTEYITWKTGLVLEESGTPIWIKAVGGLGLGIGFWTFGYVHLVVLECDYF